MNRPMKCSLCGQDMPSQKRTAEIAVFYCLMCRHRCAEHLKTTMSDTDYHAQYDQGAYIDDLEKTRRRQANRIFKALARMNIKPDKLIDFGAGRGWFVSEAIKHGAKPVAGTDTSDLSINTLKSLGAETVPIHFKGDNLLVDARALTFQPEILSLLDVIEHFSPERIEQYVREIFKTFPKLRWVIIKVPLAEGLFFRLANLLARFGFEKSLHQLFQVGTFPPHFHYFSKHSLSLFLTKVGLTPRQVFDDADIDDLAVRANFGKSLRWASPLITAMCVLLGKIVGHDSRIVIAEVNR